MPDPSNGVRITMWSGPRNISTALMRAWSNRPDTHVCDEPFYAYYLTHNPVDHPGVDEIVDHHETDWREVVRELIGPIPRGRSIYYQKQMAHHLLPEIDRGWIEQVTNCFLIRDPLEMLTSLVKRMPMPGLADTGLPQQVELFERVRQSTGRDPAVIDSRDVLEQPEAMLRKFCASVGVPFSDRMLSWPPGRRDTDGVWARHWYDAVERSTGFQPYRPKNETLAGELDDVHAQCVEYYERLYRHRLKPDVRDG